MRKKETGVKRRWQMITYFVSCTSSPRRALMWIIKCKLPGVICHVAWRTQGVSNSEQMLLSTSPAKKNLSCGSQFPLLLLVPDGQIGATPFFFMKGKKNITFAHVLIAAKRNNNERAGTLRCCSGGWNSSSWPPAGVTGWGGGGGC